MFSLTIFIPQGGVALDTVLPSTLYELKKTDEHDEKRAFTLKLFIGAGEDLSFIVTDGTFHFPIWNGPLYLDPSLGNVEGLAQIIV